MITIIQRVAQANVSVKNEIVAEIGPGTLALVAIQKNDSEKQADRLLRRILNYRIFADENDRMNLSLTNINGGLLLVPQFTLAADTHKGNRPSFASAAPPELGKALFEYLVGQAQKLHPTVASGIFGADMQVALINDGPVTFTLQTG